MSPLPHHRSRAVRSRREWFGTASVLDGPFGPVRELTRRRSPRLRAEALKDRSVPAVVPFGWPQVLGAGLGGVAQAISVDLNGDTDLDLAVAGYEANNVVWYENQGGSAFAPAVALDTGYTPQVVAVDLDGDSRDDVATGASGGPQVKVFSGRDLSLLGEFMAYAPESRGGVSVAAGDLDGGGRAEVVTAPGAGEPAQVKVYYHAGRLRRQFLAADPADTAGFRVRVAAGANGPVLAVGSAAGGQVRTFDARTFEEPSGMTTFDPTLPGGVFVG